MKPRESVEKAMFPIIILAITFVMLFLNFSPSSSSAIWNDSVYTTNGVMAAPASTVSQYYYPGYDYNPSLAVQYASMIDTTYYHKEYYPSGINKTAMQKNMDYFYNSEDCAHFVSEALIAGGLVALANNPPGDNLVGYDSSAFVGSYGIVGVYRLADYLAGYDLPVFPNNTTVEKIAGYYPIPFSYAGSPHASIYYVTNDSMMPSYFLSPGDVIVDGGAGSGHAMLYIGNGMVIQTDPAGKLDYSPGIDYNISFSGMLTLDGSNVTSLYIHMPTISSQKTVGITLLDGSKTFTGTWGYVAASSTVSLVASFPDGVGFGNYSYDWYDNGNLISQSQTFSFAPYNGTNHIEVLTTGSNGTAENSFTLYAGNHPFTIVGMSPEQSYESVGIGAAAAIAGSAAYLLFRKK